MGNSIMFTTEEWQKFVTLDMLTTEAGMARNSITKLVAKELTDNALDAGGGICLVGPLGERGFYVHDMGPGIDLDKVADIFSVRRPLRSTKYLRLPSRGALGNGLRVVVGAVLCTGGTLVVHTRGKVLNPVPQQDGFTKVEEVDDSEYTSGTRVEVTLGPEAGPRDLSWANWALKFAVGRVYEGKTSPWWYSATDFHALCQRAGETAIEDLVKEFDGCGKHLKVVTRGFRMLKARHLTQADAGILLAQMQAVAKPINAKKLGECNTSDLEKAFGSYSKVTGVFRDTIPFVVECWIKISESSSSVRVIVNRSPSTGYASAFYYKNGFGIAGCNLSPYGDESRAKVGSRHVNVVLSIISPYVPITSSGKSPDLSYFKDRILEAIRKAAQKAVRAHPKGTSKGVSQKSIVLTNLSESVDAVSVNGAHKYNQRMLFYHIRDIVKAEGAGELTWENFTDIIDDYEFNNPPVPNMTRDDRGSLYVPHENELMSLGEEVAEYYEPPEYTFNKIMYIENEGFFPILRDEKWPERHDCAILSSKGNASRAAKDLIDRFGDCKVAIFCVHDGDAPGTMIYQTLQNETVARKARNVQVINLGIEPWEGIELGLRPEPVTYKKRQPVADYAIEHNDDDCDWDEWLQTHRIELNALPTVDFLDWLDGKIAEYDAKVIPPAAVIDSTLRDEVRENLTSNITARILQEADLEGRVDSELERLKSVIQRKSDELIEGMEDELAAEPVQSWRDLIKRVAEEVIADGDF